MSTVTGAAADLARALGSHDSMNGIAAATTPTPPSTAVVPARNLRRPLSTTSLAIRHSSSCSTSVQAGVRTRRRHFPLWTTRASATAQPQNRGSLTIAYAAHNQAAGPLLIFSMSRPARPLVFVAQFVVAGLAAAFVIGLFWPGV